MSLRDIQLHLCGIGDPTYRLYENPVGVSKSENIPKSNVRPTKPVCLPRASFAVVTINNGIDRPPSVRYPVLGMDAPRPVENVESFHYIPNCSGKVQSDDYYFGCAKAGLKTQKSLRTVLAFLSGNSSSKIVVGESAIVERLEIKRKGTAHYEERSMFNITQFCETTCMIRQPIPQPLLTSLPEVGLNDTQFINLQSSNLKAQDKIEEFSSVNILSGICLFSQEHLGYRHGELAVDPQTSKTTQNEPSNDLIPLPVDKCPTLYEIESLVRLPNAIANIVCILPTTLDTTITLDVPQAQYYAALLDLYAGGRCTREHINSWLRIIDRRHDQIAEVFKKAVKDALQRRGVDRKNVRVELSIGLKEVIPYIQEMVNRGGAPAVDDLLNELLRLDPLFREYYEHLPQSQHPPQNLASLCFTSYTYQVLRPVFRHAQECQASRADHQKMGVLGRQLLINIDNAAEWRIYSQADNFLKGYQKKYASITNPLLLGIFPSELVFTAENTGRTSLYLRNVGQHIYDESRGVIVSPGDIVERVYGTDVTKRVVGWMRQEGMFDMTNILTMPGTLLRKSSSTAVQEIDLELPSNEILA